ncbi:MAG: spore coat protein CotJB [Bacilli bacterium]|nr:spore coat protein CotJB [Bacilli bacterium]
MQFKNYFEKPYNDKNYDLNKIKPTGNKFLPIMEGFLLGNMEKGTYIPYKNYKPSFGNNYNPKDGMLMTIQAYEFACTDLGLYLDLNPNDVEALNLYRDYQMKLDEACKIYSEQYAPLERGEFVATSTWEWLKPWPFERGES